MTEVHAKQLARAVEDKHGGLATLRENVGGANRRRF
jgi:hypothetical protein